MVKLSFPVGLVLVSLALSVQCTDNGQTGHKSQSYSEESFKYTVSQQELNDEEQLASSPLKPEPFVRPSSSSSGSDNRETSEFFWLALGFILGGMIIPILHHRYRAAEFTDEYLAEVYYNDYEDSHDTVVTSGGKTPGAQDPFAGLNPKPSATGSHTRMKTRSSASASTSSVSRLRCVDSNSNSSSSATGNSLGTQIVDEFNNVVGLLEHANYEVELFKSIRNPLV